MNELVAKQQVTGKAILQLYTNMKKDSTSRKSTEYFKRRTEALNEHWANAEQTHAEIIKIKELSHEYWTLEYYKQIEKSYQDCYKYIQDSTTCINESSEDEDTRVKYQMQRIQDLQQIMNRIDDALAHDQTIDRYEILSEKLINQWQDSTTCINESSEDEDTRVKYQMQRIQDLQQIMNRIDDALAHDQTIDRYEILSEKLINQWQMTEKERDEMLLEEEILLQEEKEKEYSTHQAIIQLTTIKVSRRLAINIRVAYRTVATDAVLVLAGLPPMDHYVTQALTGHGSFSTYLFKIKKRGNTPSSAVIGLRSTERERQAGARVIPTKRALDSSQTCRGPATRSRQRLKSKFKPATSQERVTHGGGDDQDLGRPFGTPEEVNHDGLAPQMDTIELEVPFTERSCRMCLQSAKGNFLHMRINDALSHAKKYHASSRVVFRCTGCMKLYQTKYGAHVHQAKCAGPA
ncbi:unnamed protein product [Brassicogethes aeneus]|uniref:Uncharacterized protein n=1 Tax=Brassicogethes aeneus TaxID=1431903 RepID=A0A9P0BIL8_BRAAE|nr:unnamed protein product [Brassicogethes aeneus]